MTWVAHRASRFLLCKAGLTIALTSQGLGKTELQHTEPYKDEGYRGGGDPLADVLESC